jgi:hypothetical protein
MQAEAASRAEVPTPPQRRRLPLAQLVFAAAGIALLIIGGAYALRFISATTFHKERAFRVLDEIGSQWDNLQRTLANQLRLMPVELIGRQCAQEFAERAPLSKACSDRREAYQRRLALQGPRVGVASVNKELFTRACTQTNRYAWALRSRDPGVPFTTFACGADPQAGAEGQLLTVAFQGSMAETVERFVSQSFFDEVLLTLSDGTVVAAIPRQSETRAADVPLHPGKPSRLGIVNAAGLLGYASDGEGFSKPLAQPELLSASIGDESYRVFVRAVQPRYGTYVEQDDATAASRQEQLYLIGLKRLDVRADLASSLEPGGRFLLTILTLLAFLVWPLANVRAKSPDDSIAWPEAVACAAAVVLIPAVLAIAAVWVWSYQGLLAWADAGAVRYAHNVAGTLQTELQEGRRLLGRYESLYRHAKTEGVAPATMPIRSRDGGGFVMGRIANCSKQQDRTCVIEVSPQESGKWRGWTTFSSVFATDARGAREGERYTVYDAPLVKSDANYDNREYFRALQRGEGWVTPGSTAGTTDTFVAQRLFSGSDGSRVLQMAVPRTAGPNCNSQFCGIVTGSATFHSLAAAVSPPLLSFAIIDRDSGIVLFHSDDSRSLAENLFVETERNPQLLALTRVGQSGSFSGRYMGTGHRFFHLPLPDAPWSVVAFYSVKEVGDLPWHAVFTALAAYAGALFIALSASLLGMWLWTRRSRKSVLDIAAGFWDRNGRSCSYARWGLALFAIALALVTAYELWAGPISLITQIMWGVLALAALAVLLQHRFAIHSICISLWLLLISAIPAAWMALGYHDVQVRGLLRDGLLGAARDIQHRRFVIADDLRRWLSSGDGRVSEFPSPWALARPSDVMPVPGYAIGSCHGGPSPDAPWAMCVFDEPPLATLITRRELDFWRRETWDASAQAETQQRRIRLLGRMNGWNPVCKSEGTAEVCSFRTSEGQVFTLRTEPAKGEVAHRDEDEWRFAGIAQFVSGVGALLAAILITWLLSLFISRRVLGDSLHTRAASKGVLASTLTGVLFFLRRMRGEDVDQILRGLRPAGAMAAAVTRVNVATKALYTELAADREIEGPVLLTNLDIALVDAARRRDILDALERLADNPRVQLLILCRRSPIEQLYHPERYPESGAQHVCSLEESLRWDNVLQKFECREIENIDAPRTHPSLATVDHHRTWKLCTRSERLLLYDVAQGRLANPRNAPVIHALLARGLLKLEPWPKIADESFEKFVRTAESAEELAQWQREAMRGSGRWRSTLVAILLIALLLAVVWFSWSAGDKFKLVSAIVAGAVAFLGQIGQAFNFVRSNAGRGSG